MQNYHKKSDCQTNLWPFKTLTKKCRTSNMPQMQQRRTVKLQAAVKSTWSPESNRTLHINIHRQVNFLYSEKYSVNHVLCYYSIVSKGHYDVVYRVRSGVKLETFPEWNVLLSMLMKDPWLCMFRVPSLYHKQTNFWFIFYWGAPPTSISANI